MDHHTRTKILHLMSLGVHEKYAMQVVTLNPTLSLQDLEDIALRVRSSQQHEHHTLSAQQHGHHAGRPLPPLPGHHSYYPTSTAHGHYNDGSYQQLHDAEQQWRQAHPAQSGLGGAAGWHHRQQQFPILTGPSSPHHPRAPPFRCPSVDMDTSGDAPDSPEWTSRAPAYGTHSSAAPATYPPQMSASCAWQAEEGNPCVSEAYDTSASSHGDKQRAPGRGGLKRLFQRGRTNSVVIDDSRPLYHSRDQEADDDMTMPSVETLEKANACKYVIAQRFINLQRERVARVRRRHDLEQEMAKQQLDDPIKSALRADLIQRESEHLRSSRAAMKPDMFERVACIGKGAFGQVHLTRHTDSDRLYAMKIMDKVDIVRRGQLAHVKAERDILAEADNEWVVRLYFSFQDDKHLYFVMDYAPGGDLLSLLIQVQRFPEKAAQFYLAELVMAVSSVHAMGFIHRDLKPDNVLLDRDGHIKLTDFGLCTGFRWTKPREFYGGQEDGDASNPPPEPQQTDAAGPASSMLTHPDIARLRRDHIRSKADSLVGTPNYIAPEVFLRESYDHRCDWWSLGVMLYEMVVGQPPFWDTTPERTRQRVINWQRTLTFPDKPELSMSCRDLILRLCTGVHQRLGSQRGVEEIQSHPFFRGIQWDRTNEPPFVPELESESDTRYFDVTKKRPASQMKLNTLANPEAPSLDRSQHLFREFNFRRFWIGTNSTV